MLDLEELVRESKRKKENEMVLKHWHHLKDIHDQDPDICYQVVSKEPYAIMFVREQTEELCLMAVQSDVNVFGFIKRAFWKSVDNYVVGELGYLPEKINTPLGLYD